MNRTPGEFINRGLKFKGLSLRKSYRQRGKFKTKFLATRQFINPTQAP